MTMRWLAVNIALAIHAIATIGAADEIQKKLERMQPVLENRGFNSAYVIVDKWPNGKPKTIFATMLQTDTSELVAFRVDRTGALRRLTAYGSDVRGVELRDVTGDGNPEALVSLSPGNRSTPVEILRWNGKEFDEIGETSDGAEYIDLDHDGVPEIVEHGCCETNACGAVIVPPYVQKLKNGHFDDATPENLADVTAYTKVSSGPELLRATWFLADDVSTKCRLRVINGTGGDAHRASGINVRLRDVDDIAGKTAGKIVA